MISTSTGSGRVVLATSWGPSPPPPNSATTSATSPGGPWKRKVDSAPSCRCVFLIPGAVTVTSNGNRQPVAVTRPVTSAEGTNGSSVHTVPGGSPAETISRSRKDLGSPAKNTRMTPL